MSTTVTINPKRVAARPTSAETVKAGLDPITLLVGHTTVYLSEVQARLLAGQLLVALGSVYDATEAAL